MNPFSIAAAAEDHSRRTALVLPDGAHLSYADAAVGALRVARVLASAGVREGDRVVTWSSNREAHVLTLLACLELGAVVVPLPQTLTALEAAELAGAAAPARTLLEDDLDEITERARRLPPLSLSPLPPLVPLSPRSAPDARAPLAIVHTAGTTGRPKGVVLCREAMRASADAVWAVLGHRRDDAWLLPMALSHAGGLALLTRSLRVGATVVLQAAFDARAALAAKPTLLSVAPEMLARLLEEDRANALSAARVVVEGAPCPPALLDECARRGVLALTSYGLTEVCAAVTLQTSRAPHAREPGSGLPIPGTEVRVEGGRVQVSGPTVFSGYLGRAPHPRGAWLDTGDFGELDEGGRLHVHARRVDLVVTDGENVYPAEVEAALETCEGVRRAFVFGVPDAQRGELVACALERDPRRPVSEPRIFAAMSGVLAARKRPRRVCFVDALPVTGDVLERARAKAELSTRVRAWNAGGA